MAASFPAIRVISAAGRGVGLKRTILAVGLGTDGPDATMGAAMVMRVRLFAHKHPVPTLQLPELEIEFGAPRQKLRELLLGID